ncbi:diaminopimelate epimerase [Rossellomorea oryzaecorticis]|uniref:Diaminopimelate epimerase n=1 Tax=Rossellomorea oryzaecorticis TaxID=1396505 RepID=A0ABU9K579_9BACI
MKQEVDFVKFNPTENMTVLVKTAHAFEDYGHIASKLMSYDCVHAEQVGFIKKPGDACADSSLWMAGGEFCGNACMSLAAFIAAERDIVDGRQMVVNVEASGTELLVRCQVRREMNRFICRLAMPLPERIEKRKKIEGRPFACTEIHYAEAVHLIMEIDEVDTAIRQYAETLALTVGAGYEGKLVGVMIFKPQTGELLPLIYVPELDSMVWERGCGSGTASLGVYLSWKNKGGISALIKQPGGMMNVTCEWENGSVTSVDIEGNVEIVAEGKAYIDGALPSLP